MRRPPLQVYFLLALPMAAWSQWKEPSQPPAITVYTQFEGAGSPVSIETMREELETIMRPLGLEFTWRDLHASSGNEVSVELVVVSFKGTCRMLDALPYGGESGALGWTHMSDGTILPFSDVDCDKIRRFIAAETRTLDFQQREIVYGRAMGRVLAHELYHVFTNTTRHATWGVAKAFYTAHDLVSDQFHFQEKDSRALRAGKLKALVPIRRPPVLGFSRQH
jgi:hypothetical protein